MLTAKPQLNLQNAREYFREHLAVGDYYAEGQSVSGEWIGQGAKRLGLAGRVGEADFLALCEGMNPATGARLTARKNSKRWENGRSVANRRVFYDFTLSPPKSVSVVGLLRDERILELHHRALRTAMQELEQFAESRVRTEGRQGERVTGNIVAATFRHDTSRELDPHLHTHCVVFNATFDHAEDRWKALEVQGMYRAQRFTENLYYHELAKGLRELGYSLSNNARDFELKGVPASVVTRFSKRHQHIDAETERRIQNEGLRGDLNALRRQVAVDGRRRKRKEAVPSRLRSQWAAELDAGEVKALDSLFVRLGRKAATDVNAIMAWADEHLFERRSVVNDYELLSAALAHGRGESFDLPILRAAMERRGYLREEGTPRLTSREILRTELEIVVAAHDGRNRHAALNSSHEPSSTLSAEQSVAVGKILGSRDLITLFRGGAGTGKSFTLREVERGLATANRPVVVLAPQRQQVNALHADGLTAETLAHCLMKEEVPRRAVVILDEAGQVGGRQLRELIRLVQSAGGRLILSGDTRQHGGVAASDALRALEKHAGLKSTVLRQIRRQDPKLGDSTPERTFIRKYRAAVKAASKGDIAGSFDRLDSLGCIRECGWGERRETLAAEYLASVARKESPLVVTQTRDEVRELNERIRFQLCSAGRLKNDRVLTTWGPLELGEAQKRDPRFYEAGWRVFFLQRYGRYAKGESCEIVGANDRGVVLLKDGRRSTVSYAYTHRWLVTVSSEIPVARGDRLQLKFNGRSVEGKPLNNGELVTVHQHRKDGVLVVSDTGGIRKTLAPSQRLFVRGYAVTSYASQGKTVDTVIFADAATVAATNAKQWYVTISRGRKRVVVFTSDKEGLRANIQRVGERELAMDLRTEVIPRVPTAGWQCEALAAVERTRLHESIVWPVGRRALRRGTAA